MRLRRSCLAVPGSNPKMLAKAAALPADMVFLDLEDAVAPLAKNDATRQNVVAALTGHEWAAPTRVVRVNGIDTTWCFRDILYVVAGARESLDCIMLPKVQGPDHVAFAHHLLTQLEGELGMTKRIGLEIQIESARGAELLPAIADASDRIETIIFGPGDYAADLGIPQLSVGAVDEVYPGDQWHSIVSRIVITARARGLQAIDGPYAAIRDLEGFRTVAERAARLGCDGKWALHPDQIAILNEVYRPSQAQFDRADALLAAYRLATEGERRGAVMWEGEMIDEASRKMAEQITARGRAAGMTGSA
jgi:citrate lyase subunit beta / citryl-CoA lyase